MDTSLSMQWEKLERSYAAAAKLLESLGPEDRFNLLLFNTKVESFKPAPVKADSRSVKAAMDWLRQSHLRGGTDLQKALEAGLDQFSGADSSSLASPGAALVLLTDGETTRGVIQSGKLADWYAAKWKQIPAERRPKTDVFAVGDDANLPLLRMLSRNGGVMEQVLSTEPVDFKLAAFLGKVGRTSDRRSAADGRSAGRGGQGLCAGGRGLRRRRGALGGPVHEAAKGRELQRRRPAGWARIEGRDQSRFAGAGLRTRSAAAPVGRRARAGAAGAD